MDVEQRYVALAGLHLTDVRASEIALMCQRLLGKTAFRAKRLDSRAKLRKRVCSSFGFRVGGHTPSFELPTLRDNPI